MAEEAAGGNAVDWFLDRHLREGHGDAAAFLDPWRTLTYAGLAADTHRFAGALRAAGIGRERRIALLLLDTVDFPIAFWGALRAGVVPVPINTLLTHEVVGYILADSRAEAIVISAPLLAPLLPVLHSLPELRRIIVAHAGRPTPRRLPHRWPAGIHARSAWPGSSPPAMPIRRRRPPHRTK